VISKAPEIEKVFIKEEDLETIKQDPNIEISQFPPDLKKTMIASHSYDFKHGFVRDVVSYVQKDKVYSVKFIV